VIIMAAKKKVEDVGAREKKTVKKATTKKAKTPSAKKVEP